MTRLVTRLISTGETGAPQGALRGAKAAGTPTGGYAPQGWRTEAGPSPWLADFGLIQHASDTHAGATVANVQGSGATLVLGDPSGDDCKMTIALCRRFRLPHLIIRWTPERGPLPSEAGIEAVRRWLREHQVRVWNVAGNRESGAVGIGEAAFELVRTALS